MESSIQLLNNWGLDENRILYQNIKLSMYLHCGCCDNYALIAVSTIHNSRDGVAKEKISRFFISQASFLLNCISKIPRRLCFCLQFELVVSSFSLFQLVKLAGSQLLATSLQQFFTFNKLSIVMKVPSDVQWSFFLIEKCFSCSLLALCPVQLFCFILS